MATHRQIACCAVAAGSFASCSDAVDVGGLCTAECADASVLADAACSNEPCEDSSTSAPCDGGQEFILQPAPAALYMVFDDSASLSTPWNAILQAFDGFVRDEATQEFQIGLQLFGTTCDAASYEPLVPVAPLSENLSMLQTALPPVASRSTSTLPSVTSALAHAQGWALAHEGGQISVVLVTDALVAECDAFDSDRSQLTQVVRDALTASPSVRTFVLGFGSYPALAAVAAASHTELSLLNLNDPARLVQEGLREVREHARTCAYLLPGSFQPEDGLWRVRGHDQRAVPVLSQASECGANPGGFYIDRALGRSMLVACPAACLGSSPHAALTLGASCK